MHPAPSLAEAPPKSDEPRPSQQHVPLSPENHTASVAGGYSDHGRDPGAVSPPARKDTMSSTSTTATIASLATLASSTTNLSSHGVEGTLAPAQAVFAVNDSGDLGKEVRGSRKRQGPLPPQTRERAALIRKLGACKECRRRRVACQPEHHSGMSWEALAKKFGSNLNRLGLPSSGPGRRTGVPLSPARNSSPVGPAFTQDPQEMEIDSATLTSPGRPPISEARIRTPLPSGPRTERPFSTLLPGVEEPRHSLQATATRVAADPGRSRYADVAVFLLYWEGDNDQTAMQAVKELQDVFSLHYRFTVGAKAIPVLHEERKSPGLWLTNELSSFLGENEGRDVLKILYYTGNAYLNGHREMVMASPKHAEPTIRWDSIQQLLQEASNDVLVLMDSPYYPSHRITRRHGVLEIISASAGDAQAKLLSRGTFTSAIAEQMRKRVLQDYLKPFSAAGLHEKLISLYPSLMRDPSLEKERLSCFPVPLLIQHSASTTMPSILLAPVRNRSTAPSTPSSPTSGFQMSFTFYLSDDTHDFATWEEWLQSMPQGVRAVKVEGPPRNTFR